MSSLSDIEWTRAYHILRGDGADIDGVREAPLHHHLCCLVFDRLEEYRIQVGLAPSIIPRQNSVLARWNAGNRENAEAVCGCGSDQVRVVPVKGIKQNGSIGQGLILGIANHARHDAARTRNRKIQPASGLGRDEEARVENFPAIEPRRREIDFRWKS